MTELILTGPAGRLGTAVTSRLGDQWVITPLSRQGGCDLSSSSPSQVIASKGSHVLNCAAVSSRGGCAADPFSAYAVNARWPARLAAHCREHGIRLVHISTDLVYAGGIPPYTEASPAVPKSLYGWTKLLGDLAVLRRDPTALVARTSVLVGSVGAHRPTFSEDILSGRADSFFVDSFRNHTDIMLFADWLNEALQSSLAGLVLAAAPYSQSRAAYAYSLLNGTFKQVSAPARIAADLTLKPGIRLG